MSKSLYSVVLSDEVVQKIDRMALLQNTNRSNLINQVLAEYVSFVTPEKRINSIFKSIEELMELSDMVPSVLPHQSTMSLKSSLEYRYRPTVKYDVELYKLATDDRIGKISVVFRTQSQELLDKMGEFFRIWCGAEQAMRKNSLIEYTLYDGRLERSVVAEEARNYTVSELADAISSYLKLFDTCLKGYLSERYSSDDVKELLSNYILQSKEVLI